MVINSGIANACTGKEGFAYCEKTAQVASEVLHIPESSVLCASTGVIGMQIPFDKLEAGIRDLSTKLGGGQEKAHEAASKAIMTTDTKNKEAAVQVEIGGATVTIGGMCKGSGMIHPNMCTMLSFVTTDAAISRRICSRRPCGEDIKDTYNMISVDGDTSTNDTVLLLANGMAGNTEINGEGAGL